MSDFVTAANCYDRVEAAMIQSLLETNGIPAMIFADDSGGMSPARLVGMGGVDVIVRAADAARAAEVLEAGVSMEDVPETED